MSRRTTSVALILALLALTGCSVSRPNRTRPAVSARRPATAFDASALAGELRALDLDVGAAETTGTGALASLNPAVLSVERRPVMVYTFPTATEASGVASGISDDGSGGPFGDAGGYAIVEWKGAPHLFRRERLIVTYMARSWSTTSTSNDSRILRALERVMGPQFAGAR